MGIHSLILIISCQGLFLVSFRHEFPATSRDEWRGQPWGYAEISGNFLPGIFHSIWWISCHNFPEFLVEWLGSLFGNSTISGFFQWKLPKKSPRFKISGSFAWIENEGAQKLESVRGFIRTHDNLLEIWDLDLAKKCMQHAGQHIWQNEWSFCRKTVYLVRKLHY